nr:TonB-dependent receptor [uncultured Desulfobulbus sp.]
MMELGFRQTEIDFTSDTILLFPDRSDQLYSAFVQDEINLIPNKLWLTLGSKYEHNDYTGSEWQPSAKLLWKLQPKHSLWVSVARAVRTPTILEQQGETVVSNMPSPFGVGKVAFVGQRGFDSETLLAYEAGYRWQASPIFSMDLALFLNGYDKLFTFVTTPVASL